MRLRSCRGTPLTYIHTHTHGSRYKFKKKKRKREEEKELESKARTHHSFCVRTGCSDEEDVLAKRILLCHPGNMRKSPPRFQQPALVKGLKLARRKLWPCIKVRLRCCEIWGGRIGERGVGSIRSSRQQWIRSLTRSSQNPIDGGVLPKVRRAGTSVRPKEERQEGVLSIEHFFPFQSTF